MIFAITAYLQSVQVGLRTSAVAMDFSDLARRADRGAPPRAAVRSLAHRARPRALRAPGAGRDAGGARSRAAGLGNPRIAGDLEATLLVELHDAGNSSQYVAESGHPAEVLQRVASRVNADLIALGTHGRRGVSRLLLGSIAEHVLRAAPCAVLTVGPPPTRT